MKIFYKKSMYFFLAYLILSYSVGLNFKILGGNFLRWIGSLMLLFIGVRDHLKKNWKIKVIPMKFFLILIPMIISMILNPEMLVIGSIRMGSYILVVLSFYNFFTRREVNKNYLIIIFEIFANFLSIIMLINFLFLIFRINSFGNFEGIFSNKNYLASIAIVSIGSSFWFVLKEKIKAISLIKILINIIVSLATGSRTAVVCLIFLLGGLPLIYSGNKGTLKKIKKLIIMLFIVFIFYKILNYFNISGLDRLLEGSSKSGSTGFSRNDVWKLAIDKFNQKPFFGWGSSKVYYMIHKYKSGGWGYHNSYLILLVETGLFGLVLYIYFIGLTFFKNIINIKRHYNNLYEVRFNKLLILINLSLLINGMSESFIFAVGSSMAINYWLVFIIQDCFNQKKLKIERN